MFPYNLAEHGRILPNLISKVPTDSPPPPCRAHSGSSRLRDSAQPCGAARFPRRGPRDHLKLGGSGEHFYWGGGRSPATPGYVVAGRSYLLLPPPPMHGAERTLSPFPSPLLLAVHARVQACARLCVCLFVFICVCVCACAFGSRPFFFSGGTDSSNSRGKNNL